MIYHIVSKQWKDFRSRLHGYFEKKGGNEDPDALKAKRHLKIEDQSVCKSDI